MKWMTVKLRCVTSKVGSGATPRGGEEVYQTSGIPLIRSMNVHFDGFRRKGLAFISDEEAAQLDNVTVQPDDVLFNITGASIGRVTTAPAEMAGARVNQHVCILRTTEVLLPRFLAYYMATPAQQALVNSNQVGGTRQAVTKALLLNWSVPLPPPSEQRRIVELLEQADELRRQRAEADQLAYHILPALFRKMFGDPATNPKELPTVEFEQACRDVTAGQSKTQRQHYQSEGRIPIIDQGQSVVAGYTDDDSALFQGKLPVIAFGDHTRIFKFIDHAFGMGADGLRVFNASDEFNPLFLYSQLKMAKIPNAGYSRHYKLLREIRVLKPSPTIQESFADAAEAVRKNLFRQQESGKYVERIFNMMLHRAFTGELTAKWREAHLKELLAEMEIQSRLLRTASENN
jgi:type I restriction enzyme S subunit